MPAIAYKTFHGEIPKFEPSVLPNEFAQLSTNCNFSDGTLRALNDGLLLTTLSSNPVKGIYTEDGLTFYSWNAETLAWRSPIIGDAFNRMYYLTPSVGQFMVATKAAMDTTGPTPSGMMAGVPKPTVAPALQLVDRSTFPDYSAITISASAWWDYGGTAYSTATVTLTSVTALRKYTFTAPALPGSPPANITPVLMCQLSITDNNNAGAAIVRATPAAGSSSRSNGVPGGVDVGLTVDSSNLATLTLTYGIADTIAYVYTYMNIWNEESAPSPPAVISRSYVQDIQVTGTAGTFTGYQSFSKYNLYRTYGTGTTYIMCLSGSTPVGLDTSRSPVSVGYALESTDYFPPVTGLQGGCVVPGGWFVMFKGNTLYKSQPYAPHAFPYSEIFPTAIRGVCAGQQAIVVTCADGVYLVPGTSPVMSGYIKLSAPQPGVAQRSMTGVDGAVAYASHDGIVLVEGSLAGIDASQRLFTREKWRLNYSDILGDFSMRFSYQDGCLIASSNTTAKGFAIRFDEGAGDYTRTAQRWDSTFRLPVNDALYYSVGSSLYQYNSGSSLTYDWWGRDWKFPADTAMGCGYIRCDAAVTVKIYADGLLVLNKSLTTGFFRLPPRRAHRWSVRLSGTARVYEIRVAQTMQELKHVE